MVMERVVSAMVVSAVVVSAMARHQAYTLGVAPKRARCRFINIARISMKFRREEPHRADILLDIVCAAGARR